MKIPALRGKLIGIARENLLDPREDRPMGFLRDEDDDLFYFEDEKENLLFFEYYWWTSSLYLDHNRERKVRYIPYSDPITVDLQTRILYVFTSKIHDSIRIGKILTLDLGDPPFELINYPIRFMQWLAEEGQDRSNIIINVGKTKFDDVNEFHAGTRKLTLDPILQVRDSVFWSEVKDSKIVYSECKFKIGNAVLPIFVYNTGKYTLGSTGGATPQEIGYYLRHAYIELKRLLSQWRTERT